MRVFEGLDLPRGWGGLAYVNATPPPAPAPVAVVKPPTAAVDDDGIRLALAPLNSHADQRAEPARREQPARPGRRRRRNRRGGRS